MKRRLLGAVMATVAAPCLVVAFMTLLDLFLQGPGTPLWGRGNIAMAVPVGFVALLMFWPLLLPVAGAAFVIALLVERAGYRSPMPYMICGAIAGASFLSILRTGHATAGDSWFVFGAGLPAGALCGLLYWRIALREPPSRPAR